MKFNEYFKLRDLTLNITNYCNMAEIQGKYCKYCFENHRNKVMMTKKQCREILDKCYQNYLNNDDKYNMPFAVNFFGGEPFTNWEVIEDALKYSREKEYKIEFGVTTNLLELSDHMIDIIEEYELGILISIDGIKEIHNRNRSNSYDLVKNNVKKLIDRHLGYLLEVRMTIMPKDVTHLLESIQSIVDMGIVNIAPVPVTDVKWSEQDLKNFNDNLIKVWEWLFNIYNDNENKRNISIKLVEDFIEKVLTIESIPEQTKLCLAGSQLCCSIGTNGDIMPCHQRHTIKKDYNELVMGNIFNNDDIKEVVFNNMTRNSIENCENCVAKFICQGGCPSENLSINGNGNLMNENQCNVYKTMVNVAINFQNKLLSCSNIRSRRLNGIVENLKILEFLKKEVLEKVDTNEYLNNLMKLYEMLMDKNNLLLPLFNETIKMKIIELININNKIIGLKDGIKNR